MTPPSRTSDPLSELRELADQCVMCGLCLPHCPTFALSGQESQSPRGRIALARTLSAAPADASIRRALETCLQCRACESVCPAGVRYGEIIDGARAVLENQTPTPRGARDLISEHPALSAQLLEMAGALARALPGLAGRMGKRGRLAMRARRPLRPAALRAAPLVLFLGCAARAFESQTQQLALQVAAQLGVNLVPLAGQGCCGALQQHLGRPGRAERAVAAGRQVYQRAGTRTLLALDSGCIDSLRRGLGAVPAVIEFCRWLLDERARWQGRVQHRAERVGLFLPCTHRNTLGDTAAVRELLSALPGLDWVELGTGYGCCGAAGPHLLAYPQTADALAQPIVDQIAEAGLDRLVTTNVGCAMHLEERLRMRGVKLELIHPVALLADRLLQ